MSNVRDWMFHNIATFQPGATLLEAMRGIVRQTPGFAIVLNGTAVAGIFTEYDILRWLSKGVNPETTRLRDVRISAPQVVHEDTLCQDLLKLYNQRRFRRFPVLNADEMLSGGIMEKQILAALPRSNLLAHYRVSDIHGQPPIIPIPLPFTQAVKRMVELHQGCLLISEEQRLVGIFTEGDLLRIRLSPDWHPDIVLEGRLKGAPVSIEPNRDLLYALDLFRKTGHRRLPVVTEEGLLVGLLTQTDLLKQMDHSVRSRLAVLNPEDVPKPALWFEPVGSHRLLAVNRKGSEAMKLDPDWCIGSTVHGFSDDAALWDAICVLLRNVSSIGPLKLVLNNGVGEKVCVTSHFSLVNTPNGENRIFWTIGNVELPHQGCGLALTPPAGGQMDGDRA